MRLTDLLADCNTPRFEATLEREFARLGPAVLPLQQGLSHCSQVAPSTVERPDGETRIHLPEDDAPFAPIHR